MQSKSLVSFLSLTHSLNLTPEILKTSAYLNYKLYFYLFTYYIPPLKPTFNLFDLRKSNTNR